MLSWTEMNLPNRCCSVCGSVYGDRIMFFWKGNASSSEDWMCRIQSEVGSNGMPSSVGKCQIGYSDEMGSIAFKLASVCLLHCRMVSSVWSKSWIALSCWWSVVRYAQLVCCPLESGPHMYECKHRDGSGQQRKPVGMTECGQIGGLSLSSEQNCKVHRQGFVQGVG